ncbi:MAG: hypothetical protein LAO21_00600 [Acidobacteriia bacterium]|nr:hypothetical protein [Terriglobia bacterium]
MESRRKDQVKFGIWQLLIVGLLLGTAMAPLAMALPPKSAPTAASYSDTYCSGFIAEGEISRIGEVLGAEEGRLKNELVTGDLVYLGNGTLSNFQKGQELFIIRTVQKFKNLGTLYSDIAHVKIVDIRDNIVVAEIVFSCQSLLVGDWVVAPQSRLLPPAGAGGVMDHFAPSSGKAEGQIIDSKWREVQLGQGSIVYLNVGTNQGVQVGSTLRISRSASEGAVNVYNQVFYSKVGKTGHFPRQILGECVILQTEENSSTAIVTKSDEEITLGDRVELR